MTEQARTATESTIPVSESVEDNAGPNRIVRLRKEAKEQGLDPNVWFGNVEVVASRDIGQETVQYVANIFKYYVAYKLALQQTEARQKAKAATAK
jgi:membrane-bound lytic murein transglycosylase MltF